MTDPVGYCLWQFQYTTTSYVLSCLYIQQGALTRYYFVAKKYTVNILKKN